MSPRVRPIVAIDGPAGAGKSSVARRVADALGFVLVDTGAMYRAVALAATRRGVSLDDGPGATQVAQDLVARGALTLERDGRGGVRVLLDGDDVSLAIRTPDMALGASSVSRHPGVRVALVDLQRAAGAEGGVVLEGRDIGTVVFPDADVKFFLTASPEVRARRRHEELVARGGSPPSFDETLADVVRRDAQDEQRAVAPLRRADDAVLVDSSVLDLEATVASMLAHVARVRGGAT